MQPIYYNQADVFVSFEELSQASDSQVEVNSCVALEYIEVLKDSLDKLMLVLCLLLTLGTA